MKSDDHGVTDYQTSSALISRLLPSLCSSTTTKSITMFAYGLVAVAVFTVLATTLFRRSKADCLHGPVFIDDVPTILKHAAVQKRPLWEVFDALAKRYGSIYSFDLRGKPVVVLNSAMLGRDLLEKKGDIYSGRPRMVIAHEILSGGMRGLSSPYNSFWKKWRKIQYIGMSGRACLAYREHQTLEAAVLVRDIYRNADEYRNIIQRFAASIVLSISYGRRVTSLQDKAVVSNVHAIEELQRATTPGKYLVDAWPILLWLPRPLQWFRREADRQRASDSKFYMSLVQEVRQRMDAGRQKECLTFRALKSGYEDLTDLELAYCVAAPFGGGVDTTSSSIEYAILSAMLFPLQAQKAQAELDRIVGRDRLPTFEDQAALPYVGAYIKELERWRPIVPLAVPHAVTRDDNFEGNWIPKGTTVYANIYTMMQDPELFSDPVEFRPERFLPREDGTLDARFRDFTLPFGFGRRQCPGMHVASQSLYILVARLLWSFDVVPAPSSPMPNPDANINHGLVRGPAPFRFVLHPRSPDALKNLELEAAEADIRLKEWD